MGKHYGNDTWSGFAGLLLWWFGGDELGNMRGIGHGLRMQVEA